MPSLLCEPGGVLPCFQATCSKNGSRYRCISCEVNPFRGDFSRQKPDPLSVLRPPGSTRSLLLSRFPGSDLGKAHLLAQHPQPGPDGCCGQLELSDVLLGEDNGPARRRTLSPGLLRTPADLPQDKAGGEVLQVRGSRETPGK